MRAWILIPNEPMSEDIGYFLGHLTAIFDHLAISRFDRNDHRAPAPPDGIDLIIHMYRSKRPGLLDHLDAIAREHGIPLTNPAIAMWRAADKRSYPQDYPGLVPRTLVVRDMIEFREARSALGNDVVVKEPFGGKGRGVERVRCDADLALAEQLLQASPSRDVVVQEYCAGFAQGDKRIMVQRRPEGGREIIGVFRRVPPAGGWKSNLNAGGRMERCELTDEETRLAHRVAEISGLDYVGLDIGEHEGRNLLIETNQGPAGLIDYDIDRGARSIEKVGRFLVHLARHGRSEDSLEFSASGAAG